MITFGGARANFAKSVHYQQQLKTSNMEATWSETSNVTQMNSFCGGSFKVLQPPSDINEKSRLIIDFNQFNYLAQTPILQEAQITPVHSPPVITSKDDNEDKDKGENEDEVVQEAEACKEEVKFQYVPFAPSSMNLQAPRQTEISNGEAEGFELGKRYKMIPISKLSNDFKTGNIYKMTPISKLSEVKFNHRKRYIFDTIAKTETVCEPKKESGSNSDIVTIEPVPSTSSDETKYVQFAKEIDAIRKVEEERAGPSDTQKTARSTVDYDKIDVCEMVSKASSEEILNVRQARKTTLMEINDSKKPLLNQMHRQTQIMMQTSQALKLAKPESIEQKEGHKILLVSELTRHANVIHLPIIHKLNQQSRDTLFTVKIKSVTLLHKTDLSVLDRRCIEQECTSFYVCTATADTRVLSTNISEDRGYLSFDKELSFDNLLPNFSINISIYNFTKNQLAKNKKKSKLSKLKKIFKKDTPATDPLPSTITENRFNLVGSVYLDRRNLSNGYGHFQIINAPVHSQYKVNPIIDYDIQS